MARTDYGYRGGDIIAQLSSDGDYEPSTATFNVYTTRTGSTQVTDLQTPAGATITQVTPDANGRILFKGPDPYTAELWLENAAAPGSTRYLVEPTDQASRAGSGGVTDHGALSGLSDDDHTQYHTDARGDARYVPLSSQATTAAKGLVELATAAEVTTGTDTTRAVTPDVVRDEIDGHTHTLNTGATDFDATAFAAADTAPAVIRYTGSAYPLRSTATTDPNRCVMWLDGPGPAITGTGSTGAVAADLYVKFS